MSALTSALSDLVEPSKGRNGPFSAIQTAAVWRIVRGGIVQAGDAGGAGDILSRPLDDIIRTEPS